MNERQFQFEWDEIKASTNVRKHGVSFEMAATVFYDPGMRTIPDVEHSDVEERWFSIGLASNRTLLSIAYVWQELSSVTTKIRLISARKATQPEARYYEENL
jgi:uncharacterized protein